MLRTGAGGGASLRMARHRMSFSSSSSISSASLKSMRAERAAAGDAAGLRSVERDARLLGRVGRRVGGRLEGARHGPRAGVEVRHGAQAQDQLHGAEHRRGVVHGAVDRRRASRKARSEGGGAVRIDVVGAVLRVVFEHEDGGARSRTGSSKRLPPSCQRESLSATAESGAIFPAAVP